MPAGARDPSPVLDLHVALDGGVPDAYRAMHERRAVEVLVALSD